MRLFRLEKKKNKKFFIFSLVFLILVFVYTFFSTPGLKGDLEQSIKISLKQPVFLRSMPIHENKFINFSKKLTIATKDFFLKSKNFENISIDIRFEDLEKLRKDRAEALKFRRLVNPQEVNGTVNYKNKSYSARIRLKGDLSDHWGNIKQWSLKFKLRKKKSILGMNEFSIIMPETRDFPFNFLIEELFKDNNILSTKYEMIKVKFNGENWGLMLMEEQYSDSFYARNKIKEAPIFRFTNESTEITSLSNSKEKNIMHMSRWQGKNYISVNNARDIMIKSNIPGTHTNKNLKKIAQSILNLAVINNEEEKINQIESFLDIDKFAKSLAIAYAFGSFHSISDYNIRYYIDPYTLKMEPILRDHGFRDLSKIGMRRPNRFYENILFKIPKFQKAFFKSFDKIDKNIDLLVSKNKEICLRYNKICEQKFNPEIIKKNILYIKNNGIFQKIDKKNIKFDTTSNKKIFEKKLYIRAYDDGNLEVLNLTSEKIKIKNIFYSKKEDCTNCKSKIFSFKRNIKKSEFEKIYAQNFKLDFLSDEYKYLTVEYEDENKNLFFEEVEIEKFIYKASFLFNKKRYENLNKLKLDKKEYTLTKGSYKFYKPLIIPAGYDLKIEENTTILFDENAFIQIENGKINFAGSVGKPIILKSIDPKNHWKGLYLNSENNNNKSKITNTEFYNLDYFDNRLIQLTGGINLINSKVELKNIKIFGSISEDSLNIVNSYFSIENVQIYNSFSDAIDFDFSNGNLKNGLFKNIDGDGVDFSGSNVKLYDLNFEKIGDKAISAGEESKIYIENIFIKDSKIGVASKDSSDVKGNNVNIQNCEWYDYAVYKKKSYFNGATLDIKDSTGCNMSIVQKGSNFVYNYNKVPTKKFSVKKLYSGVKQ